MIKDKPPDHRQILRRRAIVTALALLVVGGGYGVFRWIATMSSGSSKHVMEVVTLKLVEAPPPPPPPPPPVQPPPPEAKMLLQPKDLPQDKPKAADNTPKPLALDAKAGPGSDSFGLGGRPGGASLIGGDGVGGGAGSRFGWYANLIQTEIQQVLQKDDKLGSSRYGITVAVWLSSSGRPDRVKLLNTTGNHDIDARIEQALAAMPNLPQPPPQDMPQPINLRIDARAAQ